ncbi:MAG TPA: tRNA 2-selenouridine(34) synthase MnmH [Spongiibacteraceae bacterium]|nr:tRNA 2-selenouridine(34) synthase MnmH [Spongiibacteraceae bacterium]
MTLPITANTAFRALFLADTPFLDVRAEAEFQRGRFPGSCNLPILSDPERERVGTCYKREGQAAAVALGHDLVSGELRDARIRGWADFVRSNPGAHLYCWRGGMRSQLAQQWLAAAGVRVPRIEGGYKALRNFLLAEIDACAAEQPLVLIGGRTGSAKTPLIRALASGIDLEHHANHRGSSFGRMPDGSPAQADFENVLAIDILRKRARLSGTPGTPLFLEDESRAIGAVHLPQTLWLAMKAAPVALVEMPLAFRVDQILREYVHQMTALYEARSPDTGFDDFATYLRDSLQRLARRLGAVRLDALRAALDDALATQRRSGDCEAHRAWIERLLVEYYDPMYDYQLEKQQRQPLFRGDWDAVLAWARDYAVHAGRVS